MKTITLTLSGMVCGGCVKSVNNLLTALNGVVNVAVSLTPPQAEIQFDENQINVAQLIEAIEDAGFEAHLS